MIRAVGLGVLVLLAGTLPRNALFVANLEHGREVPWSVPLIAAYITLFWRYAGGWGPPTETAAARRESLRAHPVSGRGWAWALGAGLLGIVALVFAVAHLDFTPVLWPYYLAVAALYGTVTRRCGSILPAVVLHTVGNLYSNFDLWLHGRSDWQAKLDAAPLVWSTGPDVAFWSAAAGFVLALLATFAAFARLAAVSSSRRATSRSDP